MAFHPSAKLVLAYTRLHPHCQAIFQMKKFWVQTPNQGKIQIYVNTG